MYTQPVICIISSCSHYRFFSNQSQRWCLVSLVKHLGFVWCRSTLLHDLPYQIYNANNDVHICLPSLKVTTMKIHYSKIFIFLTGILVGFVLFIAHNKSSNPVYEWKNKSNTLILSVSHNGTNYGSLPFGDYHSFFLTPYANGKIVPRGTLITVSDNFFRLW